MVNCTGIYIPCTEHRWRNAEVPQMAIPFVHFLLKESVDAEGIYVCMIYWWPVGWRRDVGPPRYAAVRILVSKRYESERPKGGGKDEESGKCARHRVGGYVTEYR